MGKNDGNVKSEAEAKQAEASNLASQDKASQDEAETLVKAEEKGKPSGSLRKTKARRGFNFNGNDGLFQFIDSHTACNDFKNDIDRYFHPSYSELEKLNCIDRHGVTQRYIGTCCFAGSLSSDQSPTKKQKTCTQTNKHYKGKRCTLVPDSGATPYMFTKESDFGDNYRRYKDVFVYMGNSTRVLVAGYSTTRIKLNRKVQVLPKSLHLPGLDCSLLLITRHGRRKRCTFFTSDGNCHLTFPLFSIEAPLPKKVRFVDQNGGVDK